MRDGLATFETEVPSWEAWDCAHLAGHRLVAELLGEVVGWAALSPVSTAALLPRRRRGQRLRRSASTQGRGIGRALLERLIADAEPRGIWTIQTAIFPENRASLALHERCGFRVVGTRGARSRSETASGGTSSSWNDEAR